MQIGKFDFNKENHTYIMGILNVTPDSFSDGGKFNAMDTSLFRVEEMIKQGADIIDIGGESTRPNYEKVSDEEEIERVVPIIEKVKSKFNICVSIDTYKSKVAKAGVQAGSDMVNDIWGLKYDNDMAKVIGRANCACCLMHNRINSRYHAFVEEVICDLKESIEIARSSGIEDKQIVLDPGVGFAKSYEQNLKIIVQLDKLQALGYPVLLGTSRKSVIGLTLNLPVEQRLEGTLATTAMAVMQGCKFVRVHDVLENARFIRMLEAIKN